MVTDNDVSDAPKSRLVGLTANNGGAGTDIDTVIASLPPSDVTVTVPL